GAGGYDVHDVATCKTYVKVTGGDDNGRGVADYIEASNTTSAAIWSATSPDRYSAADGTSLGKKPGPTNFLIYWDADESRELEDGTSITKFGGSTLQSCSACASNNGTKSTPVLTADLFGDWREEIIWRQSDNKALRVYTTTDVTKRRIYTLMHDPTYRAQVSFEQSAYNQPPHTGFHIGAGMAAPPKPDIHIVPRAK
ncbi:MAG TPA: rhamnogalacturonan lyase, partial [Polyangiaceae bacterium]|nr:rhamnogalacturonan lyase [Polyangiaceae bacterium]